MNEIEPLHVDVADSLAAWQEVEVGTNFCPDNVAGDSFASQQLVKALRLAWRQTVRKRRIVRRCIDKKNARTIACNQSSPVRRERRLALCAATRRYADEMRDAAAPFEDRRSHAPQDRAPRDGGQFLLRIMQRQRVERGLPKHPSP